MPDNRRPPAPTTKDLVARRLIYPAAEAARLLGISRATLYNRYHQGRLELVRIDGRTFVRAAELDRYVATEGGGLGPATGRHLKPAVNS